MAEMLGLDFSSMALDSDSDDPARIPLHPLLPDEPLPQQDAPLPQSATGIPVLDMAQTFIDMLRNQPSIDDSLLSEETLCHLRDPPKNPAVLTPDEICSIELFLANIDGADKTYIKSRAAMLRRHPDDDILSLHLVKKRIAELTGVEAMVHDMCPDSCMAYTGPWADLDSCRFCSQPRFEPDSTPGARKARRQFETYPLAPQVQARFRSPSGATDMRHRQGEMDRIMQELLAKGQLDRVTDIIEGSDFWNAHQRGEISEDDICVIFSMDGAQLYEHKASNCWIYIWILVDVAPDRRYKKKYIIPGAIIPGPTKPKNFDSFLYPGLHHIAALQREGFKIWDAARDVTFVSRPWVFLAEADAIGAPDQTGYVSHHGKYGCRLRCGRAGRRKPGGSHYYSVCLRPHNYSEQGCDDDDYEPYIISDSCPLRYQEDLRFLRLSTSQTNYEARRLETGLSKPSIFSGLCPKHTLPIPRLFPGDIMHSFGLNIPELFYRLWHGTIECDTRNGDSKTSWGWVCLTGAVWTSTLR